LAQETCVCTCTGAWGVEVPAAGAIDPVPRFRLPLSVLAAELREVVELALLALVAALPG